MGRGKIISIVGAYDFYTQEYKDFAAALSHRLAANLDIMKGITKLGIKDDDFTVEKEQLKNNYAESYRLEVFIYIEADGSKEVFYDLEVPIDLNGRQLLNLRFNPNGLCDGATFNFDGIEIWQHFIGDVILYLQRAKPDKDYMAQVKKTRACYRDLYQLLGCNKVLLQTDGWYNTEAQGYGGQVKQSLDNYINALQEEDKVRVLPIEAVLQGSVKIKEQKDYFDLALIDDLSMGASM